MDSTEDQKRQKSSADRVNNFIDSGRSVRNKINTTKNLIKKARRLRMVLAISPFIALIGFIILMIIIIVFIFAPPPSGQEPLLCSSIPNGTCQTSCTSPLVQDTSGAACRGVDAGKVCCIPQRLCEDVGGTCSPRGSCDADHDRQEDSTAICNNPANPTCCVPRLSVNCDPMDPASSLRKNYNIIAATSDKSQLLEICQILAIPSASSSYQDLLKNSGTTHISFDSEGCGGRVDGYGDMTLHSFFNGCNANTRRYILIHETGHIIAFGFTTLYRLFESAAYHPRDPVCYYYRGPSYAYPYYLRTYPNALGKGGSGRSESFAESLADYVLPGYALGKGLNYQGLCTVGWAWERANIFGGYASF